MNRITNIGKIIKELTNRLDEVHPYSSLSINNQQNKNDGINYWKGKKIISVKDWNDLYEKNSTYTDTSTTTLTSGQPLHYFPDDYNGSISSFRVIDEIKEETQKWNKEYYELFEYRKNPILGRMKCSNCILSGFFNDPIFVGMEKVFARIVMTDCNNNEVNNANAENPIISHPCKIMNFFQCPFESKKEENDSNIENNKEISKYPYKREDLFALQRVVFAIEQAISTFFEITKNNEIIYEVDFVNDRVQEIDTKYNDESESWGWNDNVKEQLSKVKPISNIVIRDEQDIYSILTNREKLELLFEEYENKNHQLDREEQGCCDEITPCVLDEKVNSNNEKASTITTETLDAAAEKNKKSLKK